MSSTALPSSIARPTSLRHEMLRSFGRDPIAYSTLQPGLEYFDTSFGYIAHQRRLGCDVTLGEPICDPADRAVLITRFLAGRARPVLAYIGAEVAASLGEIAPGRFFCPVLGVDKVIALGGDDPLAAREVRGAVRRADKRRFTVRRCPPGALAGPLRARLGEIGAGYVARSPARREMRFLNRPTAFDDDGLARLYLLFCDGGLFGYAVLDPSFEGGRPRGFLLNQLRFEPTRLWGVYYAVVAKLAAELRAEGLHELSLGCSPFHDAPGARLAGGRRSRVLDAQLALLQAVRRRLYDVDPLVRIKATIPGAEHPRYLAIPSRWPLRPVLALTKLMGLSFGALAAGRRRAGPAPDAAPPARLSVLLPMHASDAR